jgi:ketosteroid isomerase-like protein
MTQAMVSGDLLRFAQFYTDQALLTDLKEFRVEGRAAIDQLWIRRSPYKNWLLDVMEIGGDADTPYQRLYCIVRLEVRGKQYMDEGYFFVVWQKQTNGEYRIRWMSITFSNSRQWKNSLFLLLTAHAKLLYDYMA